MAGRLRAKQIPTLRPGRHGDGGTLFLVVEPSARSRHWVQRLTVNGKRRDLGLGGYPYVGLAEARAAAFANRQLGVCAAEKADPNMKWIMMFITTTGSGRSCRKSSHGADS